MKVKKLLGFLLCIIIALQTTPLYAFAAGFQLETVSYGSSQAAGIAGFVTMWDTPVKLSSNGMKKYVDKGTTYGAAYSAVWDPAQTNNGAKDGAYAFDAIHRSMLVRFPGIAAQIADKLSQGYVVESASLKLPYVSTELWADFYDQPSSFVKDSWKNGVPRWHANASLLRKPWTSDQVTGPTYNANANGKSYWKKYGAQDTQEDRYANVFRGEVSSTRPDGSIDVTNVLNNSAYGSTIEERISNIEYNGFIIKKEETFDIAFNVGYSNGYEFEVAVGPRAIITGEPKFEIKYKRGSATQINTSNLKANTTTGGTPTAKLLTADQFNYYSQKYALENKTDVPQWKRDKIVKNASFPIEMEIATFPKTYADYVAFMEEMMAIPLHESSVFELSRYITYCYAYADALPEPVKQHWYNFWVSWLQPQLQNSEIINNVTSYNQYWDKYKSTFDWRGSGSLLRAYSTMGGTQNFNFFSIQSTLLGGNYIGDKTLYKTGLLGLENILNGEFIWKYGTTQESIDHYYYAVSIGTEKLLQDFSPNIYDRVLSKITTTRSMEDLTTLFHPMTKRFVSPSNRTGTAFVLGLQDGLQSVVDSIIQSEAYTDLDLVNQGKNSLNPTSSPDPNIANVRDMPIIGTELVPSRVAASQLKGSYADDWMADIVDNKTYPYEVYGQEYSDTNSTNLVYKYSYLSKYYSMASRNAGTTSATVPFIGQWVRKAEAANSMVDIGTMLIRGGLSGGASDTTKGTVFLDTLTHGTTSEGANGLLGNQGINMYNFQDKNRLISIGTPRPNLDCDGFTAPTNITGIQTSMALMNFQANPTWELYVGSNGTYNRVTSYPFSFSYGQKILIKDGVSFMAVTPVASAATTLLSRTQDVTIRVGSKEWKMQGSIGNTGCYMKEALVVDANIYKGSEKAIGTFQVPEIDQAYSGFIVEMGDTTQYADFNAFKTHINSTTIAQTFDGVSATKNLTTDYTTGTDIISTTNALVPNYGTTPNYNTTNNVILSATVNGVAARGNIGNADNYKILRDTNVSQVSKTGTISKNGVTFTYKNTDDSGSGVATYNGMVIAPDDNQFYASYPYDNSAKGASFDLKRGNVEVTFDKSVGATDAYVNTQQNVVRINFGCSTLWGKEASSFRSTCALIKGMSNPTVYLNGQPTTYQTVVINGVTWLAVQLMPEIPIPSSIVVPSTPTQLKTVLLNRDNGKTDTVNVNSTMGLGYYAYANSGSLIAGYTTSSIGPYKSQVTVNYYSSNSSIVQFYGVGSTPTIKGIAPGYAQVWLTVTYNGVTVQSDKFYIYVKQAFTTRKIAASGITPSMNCPVKIAASNAIDDILSTAAQGELSTYEMTFDLNNFYTVDRIRAITSMNGVTSFNISTSMDGINWTYATSYTVPDSDKVENRYMFNYDVSFTPTLCKFVKFTPLTLIKPYANGYYLTDFEIYGDLGTSKVYVMTAAINLNSSRTFNSVDNGYDIVEGQSAIVGFTGTMSDSSPIDTRNSVITLSSPLLYLFDYEYVDGKLILTAKNSGATTSTVTTISATIKKDGYTVTTPTVNVIIQPSSFDTNPVTGISISTTPTNTFFTTNSAFNTTGGVISVTKADNSTSSVSITTAMTSAPVMSAVGDHKVLVIYGGKITTYQIRVNTSAIGSSVDFIDIQTPSKYLRYVNGTNFINSGMVVRANYVNGTSATVTGYTIQNAPLTYSAPYATIDYNGGKAYQQVEIVDKFLSKNDLYTIITKAKSLKSSNYTIASFTNTQQYLTAAQTVFNNVSSNVNDIDKAANDLSDSMDVLVAFKSVPINIYATSLEVMLKNVNVFKYRINNGSWQTSPVFTGLTPNTTYTVDVKANDNASDIRTATVKIPFALQVTINSDSANVSGLESSYKANDQVSLYATPTDSDTSRILYWKIGNDIISTSNSCSFTLTSSVFISVYVTSVTDKKVTFKDSLGNTTSCLTTYAGGSVTAPTAPKIDGYIFDKWTTDGVNAANLTSVTNDIEVYPIYKTDSVAITKYLVYVNGVAQIVNYGAQLTLTAPTAPTGFTFAYWTIDGQIESTSATLTTTIRKSVKIDAVYTR